MTNLKTKKELAARVFGVGKNRLKLNTEQIEKFDDAITRGSIRSLKKDDVVILPKKQGISRGRHRQQKKKQKRGRTQGSKEGAKYSRLSKKSRWMIKVRAQRRRLKISKDRQEISNASFWELYKMSSSGGIRSVKHLIELIAERKGEN